MQQNICDRKWKISQGGLAAGPIGTRGRPVNVPDVPTLGRERCMQNASGKQG